MIQKGNMLGGKKGEKEEEEEVQLLNYIIACLTI